MLWENHTDFFFNISTFFSTIPTFKFFLHVPFRQLLIDGNDTTEINLEDHSLRSFLNLKSQFLKTFPSTYILV